MGIQRLPVIVGAVLFSVVMLRGFIKKSIGQSQGNHVPSVVRMTTVIVFHSTRNPLP